jgi:hypothetical protein
MGGVMTKINVEGFHSLRDVFDNYFSTIGVFVLSMVFCSVALANPIGGQVASGAATISSTTNTQTITQTTDKAIINWQSFNIDANESTHFQQPVNGVALNRINPQQGVSQIFGRLSATGTIILVNQAGIFFGPGARVDVGSLIGSTSDISNENFLNGNYKFDQTSPYAGSIVNQGAIIARDHGLVALLGTAVRNDGRIQANLGNVVLASGAKFTVSFSGDDLINFTVDEETNKAGVDRHGKTLRDGVSNSGAIYANGGTVLMTAKVAQHVVRNVINMKGIIEAKSVAQRDGRIFLIGGEGTVKVSGRMNASGYGTNERGGTVKVLGQHVRIKSRAHIDVSGDAGGGTILVGGNTQGLGTEMRAQDLSVSKGATFRADAITRGDGGKIIFWSDHNTQVSGTVSAKGGSVAGNGGFVETSGHYLMASITPNLTAAHGTTGMWLIDPSDLTISSATTSNTNFSSDIYTANQPDGATVPNLNVTDLETALLTANITVLTTVNGTGGNGDIFVNAPVTWASNNTLTLSAYRNIVLNETIANTNGASSANIVLRSDNTGMGIGTICGAGSSVCGGSPSGFASLSGSGTVTAYYNPVSFGTQDTLYTGGSAPVSYMLVNSASDLNNINNFSLSFGQNYALGRNIDLSGIPNFTPIGNQVVGDFYGNFDGQGYAISNLTISDATSGNRIGLFGSTNGSTLANFTLNNISIAESGDNVNVGGVVGNATSTLLNNIHVTSGTVDVSWDSVNPINVENTGGLVGYVDSNSTIMNSTSAATVTSSLGNITGNGNIGGLIGVGYGVITNSSASGAVSLTIASNSGANFTLGGLIGSNGGSITNSSVVGGSVVLNSLFNSMNGGSEDVGGMIGANYNSNTAPSITAISSSNTVTVNGDNVGGTRNIGGLIGYNQGSIANATSSGSVNVTGLLSNNALSGSNENIGGLIGSNNSFNTNTFANVGASSNLTVTMDILNVNGGGGGLPGAYANIGGLIGSSNNALIDGATSSGTILVTSDITSLLDGGNTSTNVGGLIAGNYVNSGTYSLIQNVTRTGSITYNQSNHGLTAAYLTVGGLFGDNQSNVSLASVGGSISVTNNLTPSGTSGSGESIGGVASNSISGVTIQTTTSTNPITVVSSINGGQSNIQIAGIVANNNSIIIGTPSVVTRSGAISLTGDIASNSSTNIGGIVASNNYSSSGSGELQDVTSSSALNFQQASTSIAGGVTIGGIAASNQNSIQRATSLGAITVTADFLNTGNLTVGGVVGNHGNNGTNVGTLQDSTSASALNIGQVTAGYAGYFGIGGLVGSNQAFIDGSGITGASSTGAITMTVNVVGGGGSVGGLVGSNNYYNDGSFVAAGTIQNISSSSNVTITQANGGLGGYVGGIQVGGLVGQNQSLINNTRSSGVVSLTADFNPGGNASVGGLVGTNNYYQDNMGVAQALGTIQNSISSSSINVDQVATGITQSGLNIGGFAGNNQYLISDSSSSGAVVTRVNVDQGSISVGGLMGSFNTPTDNAGTPLTQAIVTRTTTSSTVTVEGPGSTVNTPIQMINGSGNVGVGGITGSSSAVFDATGVVGASTSGQIYIAVNTQDTAMTGNPVITFVGGLFGQLGGGTVVGNPLSASSLTANLTNNSGIIFVGGLIGLNNGGVTIGSIPPTLPVLAGLSSNASVNVTIDNSNNGVIGIGGLVGGNIGGIGQSFNTGAVNVNVLNNTTGGVVAIGGLMGGIINPFNPPPLPLLTNSYNMGAVSVTVQNNSSQILTGGISGTNGFSNSSLGPLPGGTISNTYNAGAINVQVISNTGQIITGGVVGDIVAGAVVTDSFWDTQTSGQSNGVGAGSGTNIVGGCLGGGSCSGGGTANLSAAATYTNAGWDFTNTWGIIEGVSYPYLKPFVSSNPRVITGTAAAGSTVGLAVNGFAVTTQAASNGSFYFFVPNLVDGTPILTYLTGTGGNVATLTPNGGANITGITFTPNTIVVGDLNNYIISNTSLSTAIGNLTNNGMLYSASGADLLLGNASTPTLNFRPTTATTYALDGNISSYASTLTQMFFPTVNLTANASVSGTTIQFNGPVNGAFNFTVTAANNIILPTSVNTDTGNQNYNGVVNLGNNTVLTGNDIQFSSIVIGNGTSLTLNTAGSNSVISGSISNIASLIKNGVGILQLSGANTYSGATVVNNGTLRALGVNAFSANSAMNLGSNGVLDLNNFNNTIGTLSGSGGITLGTAALTVNELAASSYDGVILGGGNVIKSGSATLVLTGANLFTGATIIDNGALALAVSNALATSSGITVNTGGTLQLNNIALNAPNVILNGGQLLGVGTVGVNGTISVSANSAIGTSAASDNLTLAGQINGPAGLTLQGPGTIIIPAILGGITLLDSLNSTAGNTVFNNGGVTTVGAQHYSGAVTLGMDSVFTSQSNDAISFNGLDATNHNLTLNGGALTLGGSLQGLNAITVNGLGGSNSLTVNTGDAQQWFITGANSGYLTQISGVSGLFSFANIQNLTGGSNSNTYVFSNGALVDGTITGGSSNSNTLNYAAYASPLSVILGLNGSGLTQNVNGMVITRFVDINTIIANGISSLTFPDISNLITITGFGQGFASTPINFVGFNTLIGQSGLDRVVFDTTGYSVNSSKNSVTFNGSEQMQFINISLALVTPQERQQAIQTTLINQGPIINLAGMFDDISFFDNIDVNIYRLRAEQFSLNMSANRICSRLPDSFRLCS